MVDKKALIKEMVDKWSIKLSLAGKMVDILSFMADKQEVTTEEVTFVLPREISVEPNLLIIFSWFCIQQVDCCHELTHQICKLWIIALANEAYF